MQPATGIVIEGLTKSFPNKNLTSGPAAVDNITLRVEPGELFFLLGPSGCGKTTLLRMIAGFIEPTAGVVVFEENGIRRDVTHVEPELRNTGMVFQSYALWPHMTVAQNVKFGLEVRKTSAEEASRRVKEALAAVQMSEYADRRPTQLSGGQQQRVALARAIVVRPSVLLLDEPLSNLDAKLRIELRSEIRRLCKQFKMTTVYVTHDQKEALSMADRIAILRSGKVVQIGPPVDLYTKPTTKFAAEFLGETNFIRGTVKEGRLHHAAGSVPVSTSGSGSVASIRPESFKFTSEAKDGLTGTIADAVYLGESTHHVIELQGGDRVIVATHNARNFARDIGRPVVLTADPADIVLVNE
jgi:iron(III) transport system ATP-binding protein